MNIREFSDNLQKLYEEMAIVFSTYQKEMNLPCLSGCGRCCMNPDVEASMLEMIPLALKIYDEGKLDEWLKRLENPRQDYCLLFEAQGHEGQGQCSSYQERPSVCRMFGVAGYFDKHHKATLSICKYIKEQNSNPQNIGAPPMIAEWSSHMVNLHPDLIRNKKPINAAIREALEKIAFYAQYQQI